MKNDGTNFFKYAVAVAVACTKDERPIMIGSLRLQDGFFSAYHMNKDAWISILLDRPDLDESIKNLLNLSYELTGNKRKSHSIKK